MSELPPTAEQLNIGMSAERPDEARATAENWTVVPYNRWTFQRVQQFTRTLKVSHAEQPSTLWRRGREIDDICFESATGELSSVAEMLANTWSDGFLVLYRGEIVSEQYFNGMCADTLHLMMSCSKSFTSTLLGIYLDSGVLELEEKLSHYLPELSNSGFAGATIQQALDMRVGVSFSENYDDLAADWRVLELASGFRQAPTDYQGPRDMLEFACSLGADETGHEGVFHYQSILTDVLGLCLQRATGRNFVDLFEEDIWRQLGTEQDLVSISDSSGTVVFEGGFNCCLRDFSRFGHMICNGGQWQGRQLVPAQWVEACRFPDPPLIEAFAASEYGEAIPGGAYHNQWWIDEPMRGVMVALGVHGQMLYVDPGADLVVAKLSSQPDMACVPMVQDQLRACHAIASALSCIDGAF